ncbi:helix-turn-helix domain-containing protein [Vagococcus entomophilus]|uniref:HTH cro/C1-type domain-containing protein n=1 Tax=Vagococcus entomophilus TaxID=1160095 RepID=A0A430AH73_9ENTE|nr:helix-turn-helix transcriptional regulator [Vagococcus entomophilus]RSU07260.1 hypothetical protein CBF30_08375 [Vagococcus entomophilus]
MDIVGRIKELCVERQLTFAELERTVGISNGQIRRWNSVSPKSETLQKIADHFGVSTDYLLGRTPVQKIASPQSNEENEEYDDLVIMFRKNEREIPEQERAHYRKEVEKLMDFVKYTMKNLDDASNTHQE